MKGISDFLAKFKVIPDPKDEKKILAEIINAEIKQNIEDLETLIEVKNYSIEINVHPAIKNLIFQHKSDILEKINTRFNGEKTFKNIY
ncbi:MAG: hypothetical protein K9M11_04785 [Candidatus Pacebacteria bacterium]|nr:hypothetical protein [Candidatus Paceibacterota bacterium]